MINYRLAHFEAMKLSLTLHRELATDFTKQIDVYAAIERLGVSLAFLPLTNMSGAYLPAGPETGEIPGVMINSKHPRSRQRYSAGHELGHHVRDGASHEPIFDVDTEFLPRSAAVKDQREATAEAFAAWFLMPRQLVSHLTTQLGIGSEPSAEDAYRLSLALGTSYLATVTHLRTLKVIDRPYQERLAKVPPRWIKTQIAAHGPGDSWGDVWLVKGDAEGDRATLTPRPGDEIVVELEELPSSGYIWRIRHQPNHLFLLESAFEEPASQAGSERYGGVGNRRFVLRADSPGNETLTIEMARPWEQEPQPIRVFTLDLSIQKKQETQLAEVS